MELATPFIVLAVIAFAWFISLVAVAGFVRLVIAPFEWLGRGRKVQLTDEYRFKALPSPHSQRHRERRECFRGFGY